MALTQVSSKGIKDATLLNEDINASAAIVGTKISPNFGSQNIATTGHLSAKDVYLNDPHPTIYFTDSNGSQNYIVQVDSGHFLIYDSTNSANRLKINSDGHVDIDGNLDVGAGLDVTGNITVSANINVSGYSENHFVPLNNSAVDLGFSNKKWRNLYATTLYGDGSNLTGITSTTINGNAANRIIAGSDTANTLSGQANLTFSGDVLQVSSTTQGLGARFINTGNEYTQLRFSAARTAARNAIGIIEAKWNNNHSVASIYLQTGDDTTNKDDGVITFFTAESGGSQQASMVIHPNGNVTNARQAAMSFNNANNVNDMGTSYNNDPLHFGSTHVNKGGMAASNTRSRITVPTAGVYLCTGMISGSGDGSAPGDGMQLNLYRNGSVYPEDQAFPISSTSGSSGEEWEINFSVLASASASDYFEVAMSNVDTNSYITLERGNFQITLLH